MRQLGVPHLVVAFDLKVQETCRDKSIPFHKDDEGTDERYAFCSMMLRVVVISFHSRIQEMAIGSRDKTPGYPFNGSDVDQGHFQILPSFHCL